LKNFHEYLLQHSLKSGGTKNQFRQVKVPDILLASSAKKSIKKSILLTKPFIIREINNKSGITMPLNKGQYQIPDYRHN
jgi:hypothetical protein